MFKRKISTFVLSLGILLSSLFLSGCSEKPFLTQDGSYVIVSVSPTGETQSELIKLPWNTNTAIMQKLLIESSFVLSDLHTSIALEPSDQAHLKTTSLLANFPEPKRMTFVVDQHVHTLDVQSLQIEVEGSNVGQVTLNRTIILQGINNPNLQPAFEALNEMLHNTKQK
ncbi:hypothetical protein [Desulfosporosinus sp. Sb-LF]|uniref:hypothetical protein n=1 Tax=Desulfosporosinus sp. Sb-LF TaxID=2560027 RepID=UPI00107FAF51|nr:hypothetical protein [Desulfosporosinus sp. Sb-LF]TGE32341.1 hypothetical protein E4K68_12095 [Desulfosporosinus sp. Sb-LF]